MIYKVKGWRIIAIFGYTLYGVENAVFDNVLMVIIYNVSYI